MQRGWKSYDTSIAEGKRIQYNFGKPHMALKGETPAQESRTGCYKGEKSVANSNPKCHLSRIISRIVSINSPLLTRCIMTAWDELPPEECKQYEYIPEGYYDLDTKALRLVGRSEGKFVFRQVFGTD